MSLDLAGDVDGRREAGRKGLEDGGVGGRLGRDARQDGEAPVALAVRAELNAIRERGADERAVAEGGLRRADALQRRLVRDRLELARGRGAAADLRHHRHQLDLERDLGVRPESARRRRRQLYSKRHVVLRLGRRVLVEHYLILRQVLPIRVALVRLLRGGHGEPRAHQRLLLLDQIHHARILHIRVRGRHALLPTAAPQAPMSPDLLRGHATISPNHRLSRLVSRFHSSRRGQEALLPPSSLNLLGARWRTANRDKFA
mmetsp:Transcript_3925/g.12050  ORF Transcript_3925/g.12050 Transcript_3925/m.12050 type:complete len:259 (+) Transcript_3925:674-1450(+)